MFGVIVRCVAASLMLLSLGFLVYSAVLTENSKRFGDLRFIYVAGAAWNDGLSPYNPRVYQQQWVETIRDIPESQRPYPNDPLDNISDVESRWIAFAFPPSVAFLAKPLASLGWQVTRIGMTALNLGAVMLIVLCLHRLLDLRPSATALLATMAFLTTATSAAIFSGQPTPIAVAGALAALWAALAGAPVLFGLAAILALIKPQVSLLLLLFAWLQSPNRFTTAFWSISLVLLANGGALLLFGGWEGFYDDLKASLAIHTSGPFNDFANMHGFFFLFADMPRGLVQGAVVGLGLAVTAFISIRTNFSLGLAMVSLLTVLLLPLHAGYDLLVAIPAYGYLTSYVSQMSRRPFQNASILAVTGILGSILALVRWNNIDTLVGKVVSPAASEYLLTAVILSGIGCMIWSFRLQRNQEQSAIAGTT